MVSDSRGIDSSVIAITPAGIAGYLRAISFSTASVRAAGAGGEVAGENLLQLARPGRAPLAQLQRLAGQPQLAGQLRARGQVLRSLGHLREQPRRLGLLAQLEVGLEHRRPVRLERAVAREL